ncbi:hypothetical protein OG21DRAFT_1487314 [Imleria badia]|nr:hypothetical protein OG21DRAFT_1487314 [Imleria badia]
MSSPTTTDILTYRYNEKLVYVPATPDYSQALSHARDAFPQLKDLQDASLSLSLSTPKKFVAISAPAWPKLVAHMSRYQIIDVQVTQAYERNCDGAVRIPDITITYADADEGEETKPAPPYRVNGSDVMDDGKAPYPRPRSAPAPASHPKHPKRSSFFRKLFGR